MINSAICTGLIKSLTVFLIFFLNLSTEVKTNEFYDSGDGTESLYQVWVIQEYWHTGLVFRVEDIDTMHWPAIRNFKYRDFIDIGWGDEKFYQSPGNPVFLAARAILWPTPSVLQVYQFSIPVRAAYGSRSRIMRIPLNGKQFEALTGFVSESFVYDKSGNPVASRAYGESENFFLAQGKYHLFRTCNTWVAIAFKYAGFDTRHLCVLNANQLFRQLSRIPGAAIVE